MAQSHVANDDEGMDISLNIDWTSAMHGLKALTTGILPWGSVAVAFVLADCVYGRHKGR